MKTYDFEFVITLTAFHFLVQTIFLNILARCLKAFEPKTMTTKDNILLAIAVSTFWLSLKIISTYEFAKFFLSKTRIDRIVK